MKSKAKLPAIFISIVLSLIGASLGAGLGLFLYSSFIPSWKHYEISPLADAKDILQIDVQSTLDDPAKDVLYVGVESGKIYSNILFQEDWLPVQSVPENNYEFPSCATEWKDHPPVTNGIADSLGVRFERPVSTIVRCYVLLDNGSLQVWTRSTDVFSLMTMVMKTGLLGLIVGFIISIFVWRKEKTPRV